MEREDLHRLKRTIVGMQCDPAVEIKDTVTSLPDEADAMDDAAEIRVRLDEIKNLLAMRLDPVNTHGVLGEPVRFVKRALARLLRWLYLPVMTQQSQINMLIADDLKIIHRRLERMEEDREHD